MIRLRPYRAPDADAVLSWCPEERGYYQWTAGTLGDFPVTRQQFQFAETTMAFTAFDETGPVGFFTLRPLGESPEELRLGYVIVRPDCRGRGYGQAMLRLGIQFAFELYGAKRLTLGVFDNNPSACRCYRALGFQDVPGGAAAPHRILGELWTGREMALERRA